MKSKARAGLAILGLASAMAFTGPALAQIYIGGSLGQSDAKFDCEGFPCDKKDTGWRAFGGYQFNKHFSAELGYANLGTATQDFGGGDTVEAEATAFDLSAIGAFPLGPVSVYGRLGAYRADIEVREALFGDSEDSSTGLLFGVGVQWDFTKNLGLRGEWTRYDGVQACSDCDKFDVDVLSVGLLWRF
jgi:OmpA-OmpF porin, OOP family